MTDPVGTPQSPCAWRAISDAPRDGTWLVVHARECGQPFGRAQIMLARFELPASQGVRGWNNEAPNGWRGFPLESVGQDGSPPDLADLVPTVFLDPKTRIVSLGQASPRALRQGSDLGCVAAPAMPEDRAGQR